MWNELSWLGKGTSGRLLWTQQWNFGYDTVQGYFWPTAEPWRYSGQRSYNLNLPAQIPATNSTTFLQCYFYLHWQSTSWSNYHRQICERIHCFQVREFEKNLQKKTFMCSDKDRNLIIWIIYYDVILPTSVALDGNAIQGLPFFGLLSFVFTELIVSLDNRQTSRNACTCAG
jgi:hypothetical protein